MNLRTNNLDTFKILYLLKGVLTLLFSIVPLFYIFFFKYFVEVGNLENLPKNLPFDFYTIFMVLGIAGFVFLAIISILLFLTSRYLGKIKNYNFIFVIAILSCFSGVLGILLGVFTLVELNKPEIKKMFEKNK